MASGSQNMTTYNARVVTGSNNAASPAGALLLSGAGRLDDATGDTWIFLDSAGSTTNPWGIKHDQANNKIKIIGSGTDGTWIRMNTGVTYIQGKVGIGYDPETSGNNYKLYVNGTSYFNGTISSTGDITVSNSGPHLYLQNTSWTKGTKPTSNSYSAVEFITNGSYNNNLRVGIIESTIDTNNTVWLNIWTIPNVAGSTSWTGIRLKRVEDGTLTIYNAGATEISGNCTATKFIGPLQGNADTATKLSNTPNNTTTFLRGDNTWSDTLTSILYNTRANYNDDTGFIAQNTDSTNPLKIGYIIGSIGCAGIYDYTHGAWKVQIAANGTTSFNGNATTATHLSSTSDSTKFYRGDKVWSNSLKNHFLTETNDSYDIGANATRWRTGYFTTSVLVSAASGVTDYNSNAVGSCIGVGLISICNTSSANGLYVMRNGIQYARLTAATAGTANSGTNNETRGTQGYANLYLGNDIARPAAGTAGGANNARGRIYLYHSDNTYTLIYSDSWNNHNLTIVGSTNDTANATGDSTLILGNNKKKSAAEASSTGWIRIYGDEANYHNIYPGAPNGNRSHYLPNATGWIVTGGNGTSTGAGDADTPVYLKTDGTLAAITSYDGNAATATKANGLVDGSNTMTSAYNKAGLAYGDYTWLAGWNGYELRAVNKSQFAQASHTHSYLPLSGGTMTGSLTFANGTWNVVGDDCAMGDQNVAGAFCLKGQNGNTNIRFIQYGGTAAGSITWDGTKFSITSTTAVNASISGSSGSCTGNAATASKITNITSSDAASSTNTWRRVWFSYDDNSTGRPAYDDVLTYQTSSGSLKLKQIYIDANGGSYGTGGHAWLWYNGTSGVTQSGEVANRVRCDKDFQATKVYSAVWNDYAEYRSGEIVEGGYCVYECADGIMRKSYERLQAGCRITSDTFGFAIGETEKCKTPIAVCGRVLVYPYRARENYQLGAAVCSAPDGKVDIMTRDEVMMYPERIVGTVSEIPNYEIWHGGEKEHPEDIKVKGRIWIYVR